MKTGWRISLATGAVIFTSIANASEIRMLAGSAVAPVMTELIRKFELSTGHTVVADMDAAIGAMTDRVRKGEHADVVIVSGPQIDMLIREGKVVDGSRVDLGKVGIGVFVRRGQPAPDISSTEAFRTTMLAAKTIGYNDPQVGAPVGAYLANLFRSLGIAEQMQSKTVVFKARSERFDAVARGDVSVGFNQISEIKSATGVDLIGPLPSDIQSYTLFTAGIVVPSKDHAASKAFLNFISSVPSRSTWNNAGFEAP